jgi:hypothetical protein
MSPTACLVTGIVLWLVGLYDFWRLLFHKNPPGNWRWMGGDRITKFGFFAGFVVLPLSWGSMMILDGYLEIMQSKMVFRVLMEATGFVFVAAATDSIVAHYRRKRKRKA